MRNIINKLKYFELKHFPYLILATITIIGALVYFFYSLNHLGLVISLTLSFLLTLIISLFLAKKSLKIPKETMFETEKEKTFKITIIFLILNIVFSALAFKELFLASSEKALISPWQVTQPKFFILYFLAALFLFLAFIKKTNKLKNIYPLFLVVFYFLSFSVCLIIYRLGYGFDPFIHQASLEFISENGMITPKTPYYLGQYSLIISINKLFNIPISLINKLLLPLLAALSLPFLFFSFLQKLLPKKNINNYLLTSLVILFLGFSPFIVTTPQNLSYLFLIASILFILKEENLILGALFALATSIIHPLSGIPAIILLIFIIYKKNEEKIKNTFLKKATFISICLFNLLILPSALFISNGKSLSILGLKNFLINNFNLFFNFSSNNRGDIFLNFNYFLKQLLPLIILSSIVISVIFFFKEIKKKVDYNKIITFKALLLSIIILLASYLLSSFITFKDVIFYEQNDYTKRILVIITILALPFIILFLSHFIQKIEETDRFTKFSWLLFFSLILTSSLYLSYPRVDKYENSRGYSTSRSDLEAVKLIENHANKPYFVLANQQVSAAALKTFGFNRYLKVNNEEVYFYPIPTGGKLYQHYLNAVYNSPTKMIIGEAMDFTEINEAYLIINKYWNRSAQLINEAKIEADSFWEIENDVFIFKYSR